MVHDQRHEDRYDIQVVASLRSGTGTARSISLTNLSRNGCRFVADRTMRFGMRITITAGRSEPLTARILWRFGRMHGVRFDKALPEEIFDHIRLFLSERPALVAERQAGIIAG